MNLRERFQGMTEIWSSNRKILFICEGMIRGGGEWRLSKMKRSDWSRGANRMKIRWKSLLIGNLKSALLI